MNVSTVAVRCLKSQPESSKGILVVFRTFPKDSDAVNRLLAYIIKNKEFIPTFGVRNRIMPILRKLSQKLKKSRWVCFPKPFRIPQDTESVNITGESIAMMNTHEEMPGVE